MSLACGPVARLPARPARGLRRRRAGRPVRHQRRLEPDQGVRGTSGNFIGVAYNSVLGSGELGIHFGATNNRVLIGHFGGGVDEFDASTGAYIKTYAPGGGWQWAGLYGLTGGVYISSNTTNDVREYAETTGAIIRVVCSFFGPADMDIGPDGHLYVCGYQNGNVGEFDGVTGAAISTWNLPAGAEANDIAFIPGNGIFVTASRNNFVYRFNGAHVMTGLFTGTGWQRPHGIAISSHNGHISWPTASPRRSTSSTR